jgi:hypothetical protein
MLNVEIIETLDIPHLHFAVRLAFFSSLKPGRRGPHQLATGQT